LSKYATLSCLCAIVVVFISGCETSQSKPLDAAAVNAALKPIPISTLRVQAQNIRHPIVKPLQFDEHDGLSPDEAAVLAVLANPSLRAIRDQRGIAQAQLLSAGILPNPQLSAGIDVPIGNTQDTFTGYIVGIDWDITTLIARQAKIDAAKAQISSIDLDIAWQEWQAAQAARIAVFRQAVLEQELVVANQINERLEENLTIIRNAVEQQQKTGIDLAAAQAASDEARTTALEITRDLQQQKLTLARLLGLPADANIPLQHDIVLPIHLVVPSQAELLNNLEQCRLDLLALKRGYESQEATVRATVLSSFPKINLGINRARDTSDIHTIGHSIAIDLPIFDRNQGAIAVEKATRQKLFDEYVNRVFEARSDIAIALADIDALTKQIESAEDSLPALVRLADAYKTAYESGSADVLSFYAAQNDAGKKTIEIWKLKQALMEMHVGLEIAAGQYIPQPVQQSLTRKQTCSGESDK
jgi:cobalt-zinc-cadmium efflux system outer membrane protein